MELRGSWGILLPNSAICRLFLEIGSDSVLETYRRDRSYRWNYDRGPSYDGPYPRLRPSRLKEFLGLPVSSRLGIAAGLLLNSRWVECYARLGFDILTYKTVRSAYRPCYPLPNWVFVDASGGVDVDQDQILRVARRRPRRVENVTSAVCFGMPSQEPSVWRRDVGRARKKLRRGQVLIVSVVGTPRPGGGEDSLAEDFATCARWAAESGADVVEANFSCPNVCTPEGSVYQDAGISRRLASHIRQVLPSTPFLVKCGHFRDLRDLRAFYRAVDGFADGIVLVNGVARRVRHADGRPVFGEFDRVGILGKGIHAAAVSNVREAVRHVRRRGSSLATIAVGGVLSEDAPGVFLGAGADAVVMGGAPMLDPHLAARMKRLKPDW